MRPQNHTTGGVDQHRHAGRELGCGFIPAITHRLIQSRNAVAGKWFALHPALAFATRAVVHYP